MVGKLVFEPPVGFAVSREGGFQFAAAGADFVAGHDFIWADPRMAPKRPRRY
jgi:hypothetical protein